MNEFKPHDYFTVKSDGYTSRELFQEHVRKTYDKIRELADYIKQYEGTIDTEFEKIVTHVNEQVKQLTDLYNDLLDNNVLDSAIQDKLTQLEQNYTPRLNELTAQLAEKINVDKIDFYYPNLFFPDLAVSGYLNKTNGNVSASSSLSTSDFIPVSEGDKITYFDRNNETDGTVDLACFFNADKTFLSAVSNPNNQINTVTVPEGASYFRFTYRNVYVNGVKALKGESYETPKQKADWIDVSGASRFNGKTIAFLGDSITYGHGLTDRLNERFQNLVWKGLSLANAFDYGVSGALIALKAGTTTSFVERYPTMSDNVDVIIVMGGINDYFNGTGTLGEEDSVDANTFNGALNVLMTGLKNKYPTKEIIFMTPLSGNKNTVGSSNQINLHANATLNDYRNAIINRARFHCLPVLDLYTLSGFDFAENQLHRDNFAPDGIHPNALGHKRIADKIIGFMKSF